MQRSYRWFDGLTLNAHFFGVSFMWNSLHLIVLPTLLLTHHEGAKNTVYGLITFVGLLVAAIVQPISGALSDQTRHRLGRRRPWILAGTLLNVIWLPSLVLARHFWVLTAMYALLQFSSNLGHGAAQGLIPDLVPEQKRGSASGLKNLIDMLAVIAAAIAIGAAMSDPNPRPGLATAIMIGVLICATALTVLGVREQPSVAHDQPRYLLGGAALFSLMRVDLSGNRDYVRLLTSRFLVLMSTYAVQGFALYYVQDALHIDDPARLVGQLMAVVGTSIIVASYPAGALSEKYGRKVLSVVACLVTSAGIGALAVAHEAPALLSVGCLIGLGMGVFATVNWAWATDLVPASEAGKYLGLSNLATAGSAATSRLLGPVIDLVNARTPYSGYTMLFALAAVSVLVGMWTALRIRETRPLDRYRGSDASQQTD